MRAGLVLAAAAGATWVGVAQAAPFIYVANSGDTSVYGFDAPGGPLAPLSPASVAGGTGANGLALSPDRRSLYVTNNAAQFTPAGVRQFDVGAGGALTPKDPAIVATGANNGGGAIAVRPDGGSLYAGVSGGLVKQFDVDAGGRLSAKAPADVSVSPANATAIAVSPDGGSAYVASSTTAEVFQFAIGADGTLTPRSPASVATPAQAPRGLAVSPDGHSLYLAHNVNPAAVISQFDIGDDGRLTAKDPASVPAGSQAFRIAISPDGGSLYATNANSASISQYDIGAGGRLTPKDPASVATTETPNGIGVSPDGQWVYVANNNSEPGSLVSRYAVGSGGRLMLADTQPTGTGGAQSLVVAAGDPPALPAVGVHATTAPLADIGPHRGVTVTASCPEGARLVGGGSYLRRASNPVELPSNGLVLGGTTPSSGAAPVDLASGDGAVDPASWMSIANYTGQSQAGNEATTFALCAASGGPAHTVVRSASRTGANALQEVDPPNVATATCAPGTRLVGGGAATSTPDQVNDGTTPGNNGNLKPLGNYPSDASGAPAADGALDATSWSAYGTAGGPAATDTVTAYALCSSDPDTPPVRVARTDVDGPDAAPGTTPLTATATCPAGTRMLGGGYRIDETVGTTSGLQPQQGYHMRGSFPGSASDPAADGAQNATSWTALVQAGGQNLSAGKHMTARGYALCATGSAPAADDADLSIAIADDPDPVTVGDPLTYTLTVANAGPLEAAGVQVEQALPAGTTFASADASAGSCTQAGAGVDCALGALASGASATVTVKVVPTAAGELTSSASVSATTPDPDPSGNAATATTAVNAIVRATPALSGQAAPAAATLGAAIGDEATLSGGATPTGTVTFDLYGPGDTGCANALASSSATVTGNGAYAAAPFVTTTTGTYRWVARYGGDATNEPAATSCDDAAQAVVVKAAPALAIHASAGVTAGEPISATATLTGGTVLTGTVTFTLYGPGDTGCATPLTSAGVAVSGNGIYSSPPFTAAVAGVYRWVAGYDGDANNRAAGPSACADPDGAVTVSARVVEDAPPPPAAAPPAPPPPAAAAPPPPAPPTTRPALPSSAFAFSALRADRRGRIAVRLRSPGAGRFSVTATAVRGAVRYRFAGRSATVRGRRTITLTLVPGTRARHELRTRNLRVRVAVRFRPTGGKVRLRTQQVTVRSPRATAR